MGLELPAAVDMEAAVTLRARVRRDPQWWTWALAIAIWLAGAAVIYKLWYARVFANSILEASFEFALYLVAFFYALALPWLNEQLHWRVCRWAGLDD